MNMSARIRRPRKILNPPSIKGFKPFGIDPEMKSSKGSVNLLFEEYEALRLRDYDGLNHHQASLMMNVSRPTFTRIYAAALQKVATAFVEGRQMTIEGGKVYFDSDWHQCNACECYFSHPHKQLPIEECPLCGSKEISEFDFPEENNQMQNERDKCICSQCQYEQIHQSGVPCKEEVCPECGHFMKRKGGPGRRGRKMKGI
ncbi:MAG: DUF134 domain-containing protein [Dysgonamonadaceae bacterium]|nr:DUF134 domain-containing protein [Dysgonamonadaceae bacterium]